jgi:hypothetical protein
MMMWIFVHDSVCVVLCVLIWEYCTIHAFLEWHLLDPGVWYF